MREAFNRSDAAPRGIMCGTVLGKECTRCDEAAVRRDESAREEGAVLDARRRSVDFR
jgi:hypothetical protein